MLKNEFDIVPYCVLICQDHLLWREKWFSRNCCFAFDIYIYSGLTQTSDVSHNFLMNVFFIAYLHHSSNVSLLLHGWCGRWQLGSFAWWSEKQLIGSGIEGRGHHHVLQAARSWNMVGPCPPGISFHAHLPVCNLALWLLPGQMISCFPLPALYLVQVPQTRREKKFQRFAWGWKAGSHVRQSTVSDPALMLWIAACRMPVACLQVSTWFC